MPAKVVVRELSEMEGLVEEFLVHLPPDEPRHLLSASLVCKPWLHLLSGQAFRRRYGEFHRTPPMLGFLFGWPQPFTKFHPTTDFVPREPGHLHRGYSVVDCRHGRVLLQYFDKEQDLPLFVIWVPMTGSQTVLRRPEIPGTTTSCTASVICGADSCSHGNCHLGPTVVAFVSIDQEARVAMASVHSLETGNWSAPVSLDVGFEIEINFTDMPSVLVGDALYFPISLDYNHGILKYDLAESSLSEIHLPWAMACAVAPILMASEDGRLGLADLHSFDLSLWWRKVDPDGVVSWTQPTSINLKAILPVGARELSTELVGSIEGTTTVFAVTDLGTYMIDLKSLSLKKLSSDLCQQEDIKFGIFPYLSFYSLPGKGVVAERSRKAGDDEA